MDRRENTGKEKLSLRGKKDGIGRKMKKVGDGNEEMKKVEIKRRGRG